MYTPNIILLNEKKYFCISEDAYILGKSRDKCDGVIKASKAVSRIHCKFHHMENENYGVEDLQMDIQFRPAWCMNCMREM